MSQVEAQPVSSESNASGLTFVRPLPKSDGNVDEPSGIEQPHQKVEFASRLFPPRFQEDSGSIPSVTGLNLGHFVLEERIGRGGMGAVFRAIDQRLNRVVALKILAPDLSNDPEAVQRFQNEARAAAKLDHDNIARVHYIGEEKGLHFIAFEFVTGTNVRAFILQKGRLSPESVINYTLQIAEALRHTSAANVVHRDVKPSNIIVSPTGRAKLVDLGLARHQPADQSQDLTVAGTALGTFDYIAPEQAIDARNVDVRSDIYSLGCTMYHMLTGEPPYPKGTMFQKVMNHHGPTPPAAHEKNPQVSVQLSRVVQKMMASNPDERYASADLLIHDLIQIAENLNLTPTAPETVVWTTPLFKARNPYWDSSRTWMAVALVLLLLVYLVDRIQPGSYVALNDNSSGLSESETITQVENLPSRQESDAEEVSSSENIADENSVLTETERSQNQRSQNSISTDIAGIGSTGLSGVGWLSQSSSDSSEELWKALQESSSTISSEKSSSGTLNEKTAIAKVTQMDADSTSLESKPTLPFMVTQAKSGRTQKVATLAEAIGQAIDNSVIEVHYEGLLPVQESAIQFSNKRVILRAAENLHPIIQFDLSNELALRPLASSAVVFDIGHGGALEVYDIDVELKVDPKTIVDEWAMIQLAPGAAFEARWCTFTVNNPEKIPASLVYIPPTEPADISNIMPERMSGRPSSIHLRDSVFRGQMDGIKQLELHPLEVFFDETAVAISGVLHLIDGSNAVETNMAAETAPQTSLRLNHVTAILGEGLLEATTGDHGTLEPVNVDVRNCILKIEESDTALVALDGHLDAEIMKDRIYWQTQTDLSYLIFDGPMFTIESSASFLFEPQTVSVRELEASMERVGVEEVFSTTVEDFTEMFHTFPAEAFFLNSSVLNPALKSASDGRNAGVDWSRSRILNSASETVGFGARIDIQNQD